MLVVEYIVLKFAGNSCGNMEFNLFVALVLINTTKGSPVKYLFL